MTKRIRKQFCAAVLIAIVLILSIIGMCWFGSGAKTYAQDAEASYVYKYTDENGVTPETGLKVTLKPLAGNSATFEYWDYLTTDEIAQEIVRLRMTPQNPKVREANLMQVILTDALDESQMLVINLVHGKMWWEQEAVYTTVSYDDGVEVNGWGGGKVPGTGQEIIGFCELENTYNDKGAFPVGVLAPSQGVSADSVFQESDAEKFSESEYKIANVSLRYEDCSAYVKGLSDWKLIADLQSGSYMQTASAKLPEDGGELQALKEKYTAEYAQNLFSSGKVNMKIRFSGIKDSVSFLLLSAGEQSFADYEEIKDGSAPVIQAAIDSNALKGFSYAVPVPYIYDNYDGEISEYTVAVESPSGTEVKINEEDGTFAVTEGGSYSVSYFAKDKAGNEEHRVYSVYAFETMPKVTFEYVEGEEPFGEYKTDDEIILPAYRAYSELSLAGKRLEVMVSVVKDDTTVISFTDAGEVNVFSPKEAGEYSVVYSAIDQFGLNVSAEKYSFTVNEAPKILLETEHYFGAYGESFTVPKILCVYQNQYTAADFTVRSPSGKTVAVDRNRSFIADELGDYKIIFSFSKGNISVEEECILTSSYPTETLFRGGENNTIQGNYEIPAYSAMKGERGVFIGVPSAQSVEYTADIDLSDLTKEDNLFKFVSYGDDNYGEFSFEIVLTDKYDSSNSVVINIHPSPEKPNNKNFAYAYVNYDGRTLASNTEKDEIVTDPSYGCLILGNMGAEASTLVDAPPIGVMFDTAEKAVYITANGASGIEPWCLLDLDDPGHVGVGKEWKGFTTNEVQLTIRFSSLVSSAAGVIVTEVAGNRLDGFGVPATSVPKIYVEEKECFALQEGMAPDAVVNQGYYLLSARASDALFGEIPVTYSLKKSGSDAELYGSVKDGVFTPTETGVYEYTITAANIYGNKAEYTYSFEVKTSLQAIDFAFAQTPETAFAGNWYRLPEIVASNGSGEKIISYRAELNGREIEINSLREVYLDEAGELVIYVSAYDYLNTAAEKEITIKVESGELPVLFIEGVPDGAISGSTLVLPDFEAVDFGYASDADGYNVYREIRVNNELIFSGTGDQVTGTLEYAVTQSSGSLTVVYSAGTGPDDLAVSREFEIPVAARTDPSSYFLAKDTDGNFDTAGVESTVTDRGVEIAVSKDKIFTFANALAANGLSLDFDVLQIRASFESLTVRFTDYLDPRETVLVTIYMRDDQAYLTVNGKSPVPVSGSFFDDNNGFYLELSAEDGQFVDASGDLIASIAEYENGLAFSGFSSGNVRVEFGIHGVETGKRGSLLVKEIGNQSFSKEEGEEFVDSAGPQFIFETPMPRMQTANIGDETLVSAATAVDVLGGMGQVTVTVTNAEGDVVDGLQNAPCDVSRTIKLDSYGFYYIVYTASDGIKSSTYRSVVNVKDKVAPEITVDGTFQGEYALNEAIFVPAATVSDNYSNTQLFIYCVRPDGKIDILTAGAEYSCKLAGQHKIVYYAYDEDYNVTVKEFAFNVIMEK